MSDKKAERIKEKNADIFGILLDSFPDMIHSVNEAGDIVYANRTAEQLLGYSHEELYSMNVRQIYADEIIKDMELGFQELKRSGDKSTESILQARDGTKIPVEIRSFGIYDDDGNFIRTFSILRDIRRIKQLQQELVHAGRLAPPWRRAGSRPAHAPAPRCCCSGRPRAFRPRPEPGSRPRLCRYPHL